MKTKIKLLLLIAFYFSVILLSNQSFAAISVTDSDIIENHYIYDMNYIDMEATNTVFDTDVQSQLNVETENDPWGSSHYLKCLGNQTEAGFILKFDFSSCSRKVVQVNLRDKISLFNSSGNQDCEMVTGWSADDVNYTTINSATSPVIHGSNTQTQDIIIELPEGTNVFYYKMDANALSGWFADPDNQWNRINSPDSNDFFKIDFYLPKYSGGSGTEADPYIISTPYDLSSIGKYEEDWNKNFIVVNDINMASVATEDFHLIAPEWEGAGGIEFNGCFDGQNHCISNLSLYRNESGDIKYLGLICFLNDSGIIKNIILKNPNIINANGKAGSISGSKDGTIENCHVIGGIIKSNTWVGGITGETSGGLLLKCSSNTNAISTGSWSGYTAGGITSGNFNGCIISDCYASGSVQSNGKSGGLVGTNWGSNIINCYSYAQVQGSTIGGLVAEQGNGGTTQNSFWDIEVSGQSTSVAGTGLTTEEMMNVQNYIAAGWDFVSVWNILDGQTYPVFRKYLAVDTDYDGDVDFTDFASFAEHWLCGN